MIKYVQMLKKAKKFERENEHLYNEHLSTKQELAALKQAQEILQQDFLELESSHHAYKYVVPVLMKMQAKLIREMNYFAAYNQNEKLYQLKHYTDKIRTLAFEVVDEFMIDHPKTEITALNIPDDWIQLAAALELLLEKANDNAIYLSVYNHSTTWASLTLTSISFIRLITNIVDNAIKETCKLPESKRDEIKIVFKNEAAYFSFEVTDHAPAFETIILGKLGERKNSTNETGDGYGEIIRILDETHASFILKEWKQSNDEDSKTIRIVFDGFSRRLIDSRYRREKLKQALKDTSFEVRRS